MHRIGRGEWYAVIELARASTEHPNVWEEIAVVHEKCSSRKDAVEAGRRLMAAKGKLSPNNEVRASGI